MGRKQLVVILVAVLLGVGGTAVLVRYVQTAEQRALSGQELVQVFVVSETIEQGTPATQIASLVESQQIPVSLRAEGAVTDIEALGAAVATAELLAGEQLVESRFGAATDRTVAGGDAVVPEGLLEVSFLSSVERGVGGQVSPGETVAVVATFDAAGPVSADPAQPAPTGGQTQFLLRKALIVNVQTDVAPLALPEGEEEVLEERPTASPAGELLVTVALAPEDVSRLVFAREFGTLWLAREPALAPEDPTPIINDAEIFSSAPVSANEGAPGE